MEFWPIDNFHMSCIELILDNLGLVLGIVVLLVYEGPTNEAESIGFRCILVYDVFVLDIYFTPSLLNKLHLLLSFQSTLFHCASIHVKLAFAQTTSAFLLFSPTRGFFTGRCSWSPACCRRRCSVRTVRISWGCYVRQNLINRQE